MYDMHVFLTINMSSFIYSSQPQLPICSQHWILSTLLGLRSYEKALSLILFIPSFVFCVYFGLQNLMLGTKQCSFIYASIRSYNPIITIIKFLKLSFTIFSI